MKIDTRGLPPGLVLACDELMRWHDVVSMWQGFLKINPDDQEIRQRYEEYRERLASMREDIAQRVPTLEARILEE